MTDHTTMPKVSRLEVIQTGSRRRWSLEEKRRIVVESEGAPRDVSATARRHGLRPSQLFAWRRLARAGQLGADAAATFVPVVIGGELPSQSVRAPVCAKSQVEIVLADGIRVVVDPTVDASALARIIGAIERR